METPIQAIFHIVNSRFGIDTGETGNHQQRGVVPISGRKGDASFSLTSFQDLPVYNNVFARLASSDLSPFSRVM